MKVFITKYKYALATLFAVVILFVGLYGVRPALAEGACLDRADALLVEIMGDDDLGVFTQFGAMIGAGQSERMCRAMVSQTYTVAKDRERLHRFIHQQSLAFERWWGSL